MVVEKHRLFNEKLDGKSKEKLEICTSTENVPIMMQYLHPDYLDDHELSENSTPLKRHNPPLALLAETCNNIGKSSPNEDAQPPTLFRPYSPTGCSSSSGSIPKFSPHSNQTSPTTEFRSNHTPNPRKRKLSPIPFNPPHISLLQPPPPPSLDLIYSFLFRNTSKLQSSHNFITPCKNGPSQNSTIKYCMYCGSFIPNIHALLNHIHTEHLDPSPPPPPPPTNQIYNIPSIFFQHLLDPDKISAASNP